MDLPVYLLQMIDHQAASKVEELALDSVMEPFGSALVAHYEVESCCTPSIAVPTQVRVLSFPDRATVKAMFDDTSFQHTLEVLQSNSIRVHHLVCNEPLDILESNLGHR